MGWATFWATFSQNQLVSLEAVLSPGTNKSGSGKKRNIEK
jgi:hypothetical protein